MYVVLEAGVYQQRRPSRWLFNAVVGPSQSTSCREHDMKAVILLEGEAHRGTAGLRIEPFEPAGLTVDTLLAWRRDNMCSAALSAFRQLLD